MTLQEKFDEFLRQVMSGPLDAHTEQYREMRRAFFAGCVLAYTSHDDYMPEIQVFFANVGRFGL